MTPRRACALAALVALVVGLGGCTHEASRGDVLDALRAQPWPEGATAELGDDPGGGRYERPRATARRESSDPPWRAVAVEVDAAVAAGWVPAYAQCGGPQDSVRVDLVREVLDDVPATATVAAQVVDDLGLPAARGTTVVSVTVVAAAPQDVQDPALLPAALRGDLPRATEVATCLDEPGTGARLRWTGVPAALPALGGPLPR